MPIVKSYQRVLLFVLLILLATSILSPWFYASWEFLLRPWFAALWEALCGGEMDGRVPFSRFFNRTFMICGILLFFVFRRRLFPNQTPGDFGLPRSRYASRDALMGFGLALSSFLLIVCGLVMAGLFVPGFGHPVDESLSDLASGLLGAVAVGFFEEIFFRGMIFKGLVEDCRISVAFISANVFYAAMHFIRSPEQRFLDGLEPLAGLSNLVESFHLFQEPSKILPGFVGLFILGMVLSYAFYRTGALYMSMGLHAGWVFCVKTLGVFGKYRGRQLGTWFGSAEPRFVSGVFVWIGILGVGILIHWLTRFRATQAWSEPDQ